MKKEENENRIFLKIFGLLFILIVCFILYARYVGTTGLKVKEYAVYHELLPIEYNGFKIAHFADVHFGRTTNKDDFKKVVKELNRLNADIVIFTGDLFDDKKSLKENKDFIIENLQNIEAKLFKFATIGDYDETYLDEYKDILKNSGFMLLDNEQKEVYFDSVTPINFVGITDYNENTDNLYTDDLNITIMHKPDLITNLNKTNITFAGHSLGGQLVIPFMGGAIKQNGANTYIDSYYKVNNNELYISNGIGTRKFSFRIFNKPSISLYRLYQS